ncbi:MAG TPA: site-specific integrase [Allosphingosinicella sp.]|jgi:integrase
MARTSYLVQRGGRWHYNRAFPKELWPFLKSAPFRISLHTDSLDEAQRARPEAERRYWARVDEGRRMAATAAQRSPLSHRAAESIAAEHFRTGVCGLELFAPDERTPEALERALEDAGDAVAHAREQLATNVTALLPAAREAAHSAGYSVEDAVQVAYLARLLGRASVALGEVHAARLLGDYGTRPADPLFAGLLDASPAPANPPPAAPERQQKARTVADLEVAYTADRVQGASLSSQRAYGPVFRLLRDVLGPDTLVSTVGRAEARKLFEAVKALPAGLGKHKALSGLSVPEAITAASRLGLPKLAPKSINDSYMALLSSIFGWAAREEWLSANPVKGLTVPDNTPAQARRDPFTLNQLQTIFAAAPWEPADPTGGGHPIRYWAPLIALLQGMRRGEIAQLRPEDVDEAEGVPVLRIRGTALKTHNAYRTLPIHGELIRLGLVEYAAGQRRAGEAMLFPGEAPNGRGQWGDGVSDWFSRRLKALGVTGKKLGLHSFRHNFEDRLREAGLHGTALGAELAGRSKGDVASGYGSGFSTKALAEAMAKIAYPGLRLHQNH